MVCIIRLVAAVPITSYREIIGEVLFSRRKYDHCPPAVSKAVGKKAPAPVRTKQQPARENELQHQLQLCSSTSILLVGMPGILQCSMLYTTYYCDIHTQLLS